MVMPVAQGICARWVISRRGEIVTSNSNQDSERIQSFIAAAPWPQRQGLIALLAIARRPRGAKLLARASPLDQLPRGLLTVGHYDDPEVGRSLGWDVDAVLARGRELRRPGGQP